MRMLHFSDNSIQIHDVLAKIKPVLSYVKKTCGELFNPFKNLGIDESLFEDELPLGNIFKLKDIDGAKRSYFAIVTRVVYMT